MHVRVVADDEGRAGIAFVAIEHGPEVDEEQVVLAERGHRCAGRVPPGDVEGAAQHLDRPARCHDLDEPVAGPQLLVLPHPREVVDTRHSDAAGGERRPSVDGAQAGEPGADELLELVDVRDPGGIRGEPRIRA